jgi:hypothetical protein
MAGHVAVRDPHPADECEADEVAQVPGPLMFEPIDQYMAPGGHLQFYDEQGEGDREDTIGECFETSRGQQVLVTVYALSRCGDADGRATQYPPD